MYEVKLSWTDGSSNETFSYCKEVDTFVELKQSFLKRFGNIKDVPNRLLREKPTVKNLTHSASSLEEWIESVNQSTRWELVVRKIR